MRYGACALLLGWLVTFVLFCLGITVASIAAAGPAGAGFGWNMFPAALIFGFPFASILGLPFALLVAWPLRRIRRQWWHVAAHATATGIAFWAVVTALGGWTDSISGAVIGLLAAGCAAIGRAAVIPMVARRNPSPFRALKGPSNT